MLTLISNIIHGHDYQKQCQYQRLDKESAE